MTVLLSQMPVVCKAQGAWVYSSLALAMGLLLVSWSLGDPLLPWALVACWFVQALAGYMASRAKSRSSEGEVWAHLQIVCAGAGFLVVCLVFVLPGIVLKEDPSVMSRLIGISIIAAIFFALTASLWLAAILLSRSSWWHRVYIPARVLIAGALGFFALTLPLLPLLGVSYNAYLFTFGGLGAGASVISLFFSSAELRPKPTPSRPRPGSSGDPGS